MSATATPSATTNNGAPPANTLAQRKPFQLAPLSPMGSATGLKHMLESMAASIAKVLPRHITAERLIKTALVAANRNPGILECTQSSILESINRAAELGLDLSGTLGEAYLVPFNNKVKTKDANGNTTERWVKQCQLIIGYRGFEKLAWQSGDVVQIDAEVVCVNDRFIFRKGFDPVLEWEPCLGDRGDVVGAYALVIIKGGGRMARFMTKADIEKIRQGAVSKDSPAWRNHWSEMARKTALRRVMKDAPLSTEKLTKAQEIDDEDHRLTDVLEASTGIGSLPAGRSSFREEAQTDLETQEEPEPTGDEGGAVHVGDVVDTEVSRAKGNMSAEDAAKAVQKRREEAKAAEAAQEGDERPRWEKVAKPKLSDPYYWRNELLKLANTYITRQEIKTVGAEALVSRLEDGRASAVTRLPGPADGDSPEAHKAAVEAYKAARGVAESNPDIWSELI